jgi:signal transduction histidine kinase/ActR/RegA family two-component response regulator
MQMKEKLSYVKKLPIYGWWIGLGEYLEDYEKTVQEETLSWINQIRYGNDGYIFVYDYNAVTLAHYKPENIGVNQWDFKDANGVPVLQELIRISRENEKGDFLEYVGTIRPSTGLPAPKLGYSRGVKDWRWMIGTGMYVDAINETIAEKRELLDEKITKNILIVLAALVICIIPIIFLSQYFAGLVLRNILYFTDFLEHSVTDVKKMDTRQIRFQEFKRLARSANNMVDRRIKAEEALEQAQEKLLRSRKMEALGVLAGGVAHDLNNVLSSMIGYPDLLLKRLPPQSSERRFVKRIKDSGQKAADIVEDLLTLARRGVNQHVIVNLNQLIEDFTQSPEYERINNEFNNVSVRVELDPDLMKISGSMVHLQKTIMNLMLNAAEAQPDGGEILITTENRYVDYLLTAFQQIEEGEYVVLTVCDKGVGISNEDLEHIFEPFFTKKKMGRSGTGLGMAVVWGTVQDHNGFINVVSSEGNGTEIELFFPVTRQKNAIIEKAKELDIYTGHGEKILVVDDIAEQRELVRAILEQLGYVVETASNGIEAIEYLQSGHADLVVLDMILEDPEMDGYEIYKQIVHIHPAQKAIIASGYSETDRVKKAMALGASCYLKKPYTIKKIGIALREALDEKISIAR